MSSPPQPSTLDLYTTLIHHLQPTSPSILEIDILPSSLSSSNQILHSPSPPSLALSKTLLVTLFLHARSVFFKLETKSQAQSLHTSDEYNDNDARLQSTTVLLLFDPNHVTAANFRKRHTLNLSRDDNTHLPNNLSASNPENETQQQAIRSELCFLTSLVTSPLHKHAKSSTLWAQRLWLWKNYGKSIREMNRGEEAPTDVRICAEVWKDELDVVMKAGERHPRNYYAWDYARQLMCILRPLLDGCKDASTANKKLHTVLLESLGKVHAWCLMHPRDISGWAFLSFLLERVRDEICIGEGVDSDKERMEREISRVMSETKEWVWKYEWRGESVEWFLKTAGRADAAEAVE